MRKGASEVYTADLYLDLHYTETEYRCPNCKAVVYVTFDGPYWVPGG